MANPRNLKPFQINALWYELLCLFESSSNSIPAIPDEIVIDGYESLDICLTCEALADSGLIRCKPLEMLEPKPGDMRVFGLTPKGHATLNSIRS